MKKNDENKSNLYISKDDNIYELLGESDGKSYHPSVKNYPCMVLKNTETNALLHVLMGDFKQNFTPYLSSIIFCDKSEKEIFEAVSGKLQEYFDASMKDIQSDYLKYNQAANLFVDNYLHMHYEDKPVDPRLRKELIGMIHHMWLSMKVLEDKKKKIRKYGDY